MLSVEGSLIPTTMWRSTLLSKWPHLGWDEIEDGVVDSSVGKLLASYLYNTANIRISCCWDSPS